MPPEVPPHELRFFARPCGGYQAVQVRYDNFRVRALAHHQARCLRRLDDLDRRIAKTRFARFQATGEAALEAWSDQGNVVPVVTIDQR